MSWADRLDWWIYSVGVSAIAGVLMLAIGERLAVTAFVGCTLGATICIWIIEPVLTRLRSNK